LILNPVGIQIPESEPISAAGEPYFTKVLKILKNADPEVMADYLGWRVVQALIPETTLKMRNLTASFNQVILGASQPYIP
jgi:hypothetical protein